MSKKSEKLYKDSPTTERGEDGKMGVKKKPDSAPVSDEAGTDGVAPGTAMPPHVRHAAERRDMANRHETEHSVHDMHGGKEDKKEMHSRHLKEHADMMKRHEKEKGSK